MADRIVIDLGWVLDLQADVVDTRERLNRDLGSTASVDSAPVVDDALRSFLDSWDERRGQVADSLGGVVDALQAIHDSFTMTEDELLAQLNGDGG